MEYTVSELNSEINGLIKDNYSKNIIVIGEISGLKISGGHAYLTLKDSKSAISCIIWKNTFKKMGEIKNGDNIIAHVNVTTYLKTGYCQLFINKIELDGVGNIHSKYESLKKKMKYYFNDGNKKLLPKYVNSVGIITAQGGAALQDILYAMKSKNFNGNIYVKNCQVQGVNCSKSVIDAIKYFEETNVDLIVLTRGGGSIEDLMGFSDEQLVKTIYDMKKCVISAIGHEVDFMLSDYVADIRAPTPSIAGDIIVETQNKLNREIEQRIMKNKMILQNLIQSKMNKFNNLKLEYNYCTNNLINQINNKISNIKTKIENKINKQKNRLIQLDTKLSEQYCFLQDGQVLKSVNDVKNNNHIILKLDDGFIKLTISDAQVI